MINEIPGSWKGTHSLEQACRLIDYGVLLRWRDMRTLRRAFTDEDEETVMRHFARRLVERFTVRLQTELLVESALIWMANAASEKLVNTFLEELFAQAGCEDACRVLVETALTLELTEMSHGDEIFDMAVSLVCEMGISVYEYHKAYPGEFPKALSLLDHTATYLLSKSNVNSGSIRLSLLHYFGAIEHGATHRHHHAVSRLMSRFGHTVLDHLFSLLFKKRSEAVALQYLLENLPFVLEADLPTQKIVHETFRNYMLKQPERFCLFLQAFSDDLAAREEHSFNDAKRQFLQHIAVLFRVVSEVNQRQLAGELIHAMSKFIGFSALPGIVSSLGEDPGVRPQFMDQMKVALLVTAEEETVGNVASFRANRRGRRPSFARAEGIGTLHQVHYLSAMEVPKAS
jgi:hypothetical protein